MHFGSVTLLKLDALQGRLYGTAAAPFVANKDGVSLWGQYMNLVGALLFVKNPSNYLEAAWNGALGGALFMGPMLAVPALVYTFVIGTLAALAGAHDPYGMGGFWSKNTLIAALTVLSFLGAVVGVYGHHTNRQGK